MGPVLLALYVGIVLAKSFVAYGQNCVESLTPTKHQTTDKFADGSHPLTKVT